MRRTPTLKWLANNRGRRGWTILGALNRHKVCEYPMTTKQGIQRVVESPLPCCLFSSTLQFFFLFFQLPFQSFVAPFSTPSPSFVVFFQPLLLLVVILFQFTIIPSTPLLHYIKVLQFLLHHTHHGPKHLNSLLC